MKKEKIAIIGGGIAGLSAGHFIKKKFGDKVQLIIFEKENHLGGTIATSHENGFIVDWGPNGFLDKEPLTLEFVDQIGLTDKLVPADVKSEKRFICRNEKLWEINPNPRKFMTSGLLSLRGRLRIILELFIAQKNSEDDETVFDFAARRIGSEAAEILINPMVSGIFGGDARKLSLSSCFPIMEKMEKEYGGLFKAMIAKKKASKAQDKKSGGPAGPSGHLTSFKGGLSTIIERLEEILKDHIDYPVCVNAILKDPDGGYIVETEDNRVSIDTLILATPSYISGELLQNSNPELASILKQIQYSSLAVVCQGYKLKDVSRPLDGFGFLVPQNQKRQILGSIWTSVIFPEQAPKDYALFRTMLGGATNNQIVYLDDEQLAEITYKELSSLLGLKTRPEYQKVIKWQNAIPQYLIGHGSRMEEIDKLLGEMGNIHLAGNAYNGIGLNDSIKRSFNIVENLSFSE
jgi:protoporphyrinogen/coproporphyrinogen III oxidase